jgi:putative spermidine/putrescine transport system substrate-binding protein
MQPMRARLWKSTLCAGAVVLALAGAVPAEARADLTFASWGGPYMRSQMLAFVRPFERETGNEVEVEFYNGGLDEVRLQVRSANVKWDVVDLLEEDLIRACEAGLLEKIDASRLAPSPEGTPPAEDFIDNALQPCGVGTMAWATVVAYDPEAFPGEKPQTLADFFDVQRFPGPRGLQRDPRIIMEWALLADGVQADQVYETLATADGVERALSVMDAIKPHLVWWREGSEAVDLLDGGRVAMTSIWGGEMTDAVLKQGHDMVPLWDGLVLKLDHLAVLKGSPNRKTAIEFVRFATSPRRLAEQVRHVYHGPARRSSLALIDDGIKAYLPTTPERMETAIKNNGRFWADNQVQLQRRFEAWLEVPLQKGITGTAR